MRASRPKQLANIKLGWKLRIRAPDGSLKNKDGTMDLPVWFLYREPVVFHMSRWLSSSSRSSYQSKDRYSDKTPSLPLVAIGQKEMSPLPALSIFS